MPKKLILLSIALIFSASFFAIKLLTNSASAELAEIDPADWRLETFFLDAEVNEGRDPIQNLVWEPETMEFTPTTIVNQTIVARRIVTLQINYHNENIREDYEAGALRISVPNPFAKNDTMKTAGLSVEDVKIGANQGSVTDYDWDYLGNNATTDEELVFTNKTMLRAQENIEGSIQVTFKLKSEQFDSSKYTCETVLDDNVTREYSATDIIATLNDIASSPSATFHFMRTMIYDWKKATWSALVKPNPITTYTGLGDDADQYTWIRWEYSNYAGSHFRLDDEVGYDSQYYGVYDYDFYETPFADDVKIIPYNKYTTTTITPLGDGRNHLSSYSGSYFVGYPKDKYNKELGTNLVTESVSLLGTYCNETSPTTISDVSNWAYLENYEFDPMEGFVGGQKEFRTSRGATLYAQDLRKTWQSFYYSILADSHDFSGEPYDFIIGDDVLLYESKETGEVVQANENNYSFSSLTLGLTDFDGETINCDDYRIEVYVRQRGQSDYRPASSSLRCGGNGFSLPGGTVSWYIVIKDMDKPVRHASITGYESINLPDAPDSGWLHNMAYVRTERNGVAVSSPTANDYAQSTIGDLISAYDLEHYGAYQYRISDSVEWLLFDFPDVLRRYYTWLKANTPEYSPLDDAFHGTVNVRAASGDYYKQQINGLWGVGAWANFAEDFDPKYLHTNLSTYILLPPGAKLESSEEEIIASYKDNDHAYYYLIGADARRIFSNSAELESYVRTHSSAVIVRNWRGTGQDYIRIDSDFSEKPFTTFNVDTSMYDLGAKTFADYDIKYRIAYDDYREKGLNYTFIAATDDDKDGMGLPSIVPRYSYPSIDTVDNYWPVDDINDNGRTDDYIWRDQKTVTLLPVASSHQNIQTTIYSKEKGEYNLDDTIIEPGEEYSYKLRLRNSTNRITNAVIYSNLEEAYEDNPHWNGEFVGVDTTFAELQQDNYGNPVSIKVYWSPKAAVGKLASDDSWQEYDESTVDKSQVKSLAFKYLDQNGDPAILPQSNYSYVLVNMKAPDDDSISTYAYNKSFSEWNPIDNLNGEIQPLLTGIESNVVRAYFSDEIEAHAKKVWNDQDNKFGLRPRTVTFHLYDGDNLIDEGEIDVENLEDSFDFANLSIANRANYHIEIDPIEGYNTALDVDFDTLTFTFTSSIILPDEPENNDTPTPETIPETPATHDPVVVYLISATALLAAACVVKRRTARR